MHGIGVSQPILTTIIYHQLEMQNLSTSQLAYLVLQCDSFGQILIYCIISSSPDQIKSKGSLELFCLLCIIRSVMMFSI